VKTSDKVLKIPVSAVRFRPWPPIKSNSYCRYGDGAEGCVSTV
jgi:hypothetical protein